MTIREATDADRQALVRLAGRDSARVPAGRLLLAEVGGEVRAAISILSGEAIADPFRPTAELVSLLRPRAHQLVVRRPLRTIIRTAAPASA
ncbi:MAG TPA: hypothetical protein VK326_08125 [Solirubrobacterales bacterium]|nr:hypothetical protein [Solirubrobacterales bacterium]